MNGVWMEHKSPQYKTDKLTNGKWRVNLSASGTLFFQFSLFIFYVEVVEL